MVNVPKDLTDRPMAPKRVERPPSCRSRVMEVAGSPLAGGLGYSDKKIVNETFVGVKVSREAVIWIDIMLKDFV